MIRKYSDIFAEKMWVAFAVQNIRILYTESAKTVNEMTLNELVKLTTLWTTGPWKHSLSLTRFCRVNFSTLRYMQIDSLYNYSMILLADDEVPDHYENTVQIYWEFYHQNISKNMLQSAKLRYLENYLWEAAVDWRQLFPLSRYGHDSIIGLRLFQTSWR